MALLADRAKVWSATTGQGTLALGGAFASSLCSFAEAGVPNGAVVSYAIEEGPDFELGLGTYNSSGPSMSRDTVLRSKISGVVSTVKMNCRGHQTVAIVIIADQMVLFPGASVQATTSPYTIGIERAVRVYRPGQTASTVLLPSYLTRAGGSDLVIYDYSTGIPGAGHEITIVPYGSETIMRQATYTIFSPADNNLATVRLTPDSNAGGWFIG